MKREALIVACAALIFPAFWIKKRQQARPNVSLNHFKQQAQADYLPFDTAMHHEHYAHRLERFNFKDVYYAFKSVYEARNLRQITPQADPIIPKLIHIIWLGSPLPQEYETCVSSWRAHHPDWTIIFWTDQEQNYAYGDRVITQFSEVERTVRDSRPQQLVFDVKDFQFRNRSFYDAAINYGEKSDILRWEIVYRLGGVYVDTDFECLRPLDLFNHCYDFYTGIQPLDTSYVQLGAALFGARPGHPLLKRCVEKIADNQDVKQVIAKTGPIYFTRCFLAHVCSPEASKTRDVAFPADYFYPCSYEQKGEKKEVWCKAQSYAVHHWAGSWLKPEGFVNT